MKKYSKGIIIMLVFAAVLFMKNEENEEERIQKSIASHIIRLHVIANSDSEKDQQLKLMVKDKIVAGLREKLKEADNLNDARTIIRNETEQIEKMATEEMRQQGYDYIATASLGNSYFPIKKYGDMTFPAGEYEALRVQIGQAKGQNFWCVMYPTLCFVDSTYQVVPEESKEELKSTLTDEEYQALLGDDKNVTFGFKLLDWVDNLRQR